MEMKKMKQPVDFDECLKDSPKFRLQIEQGEHEVTVLEGILDKIIKQCNTMVDSGKMFTVSTSGLVSAIQVLVKYFDGDEPLQAPLRKFCHAFVELKEYLQTLLDQTKRSVSTTLFNFVKNDVKRVKETKKLFDKISDDLDNALNKHAQLPKTCKQQEMEEDKNILTAMQSCFDHISLDYAFQINLLQSRKRIEVLDALSKSMHSHFTYYHQGYDMMNDLEVYMKNINGQLDELSSQFTFDKKEMEERHTLVQRKGAAEKGPKEDKEEDSNGLVIEGYLFKRSSNTFKTWQRRYFTVKSNQLFYQKRSKDDLTILVEDLRLCIVKINDEIERRNCFDVVSPTKSWTLQADSESIRDDWMKTMQSTINKAFTAPAPETDKESEEELLNPTKRSRSVDSLDKVAPPPSILSALRSVPGNEICADCNHTDPKWASINLGVVLCIECSGIHRSLGVHVSKVRSLTLDAWEPEHLKLMSELGNALINSIYEANIGDKKKINHISNRGERESWIKSKYIYHRYVSLDKFLRTSDRLHKGIIGNLARMKVYHEQKNNAKSDPHIPPSLEKSDSKVHKILKMTHGLKKPFKGDKDKRKSTIDVSGDGHSSGSVSTESPVMDRKGKSNNEKKHKSRLRKFSRGRKEDFFKVKKHLKGSIGNGSTADISSEGSTDKELKSDSKSNDTKSSSENLFVKDDSGMGSTGLTDESCDKDYIAVDIDQQGSLSGSVSSDLEVKTACALEGSEADEEDKEEDKETEDSTRTWASKVLAEHSLDSDQEAVSCSRSRSESTDSVLSEEGAGTGVTSPLPRHLHGDENDDEAFQEDLEKAISVLKILHPNRLLYKAAEWNSIPLMVAAFAEGAKANWLNEDDDSKTVLHQSVLGGSLTASEYLLQNGAKVNHRDCRGRSALHHAALLGQTGQTCLFLKRGANQHAVDENGEDPLTIALKQSNADIVTLLRIARLNDEMREGEELTYGSSGDVTFTDVFRDFSNMASMNPDRLKRDFTGSKDDPHRQTSL